MNVRLLVVQGKPEGKTLHFGPGDYYFGRGPECHVRFNSDWVSRQHCLLRITAALVVLRDLQSRNGTLVNGHLLDEQQALKSGDQVQVGPVVFEVRFESPEAGAPSAPKPEILGTEDQDNRLPSLESTLQHPYDE